jgi:hypothetical protein
LGHFLAFSFLQRGNLTEHARELSLGSYQPFITVEGLATGIDNVRSDVFLSPKYTEVTRQHISRLISKHGAVEDLNMEDPRVSGSGRITNPGIHPMVPARSGGPARQVDPTEFKKVLLEMHTAVANKAKAEANLTIDLLGRLAILKLQRTELNSQFGQVTERCRARLKAWEGPRQPNAAKAVEVRERFAQFQINKKTVLRKTGQDLFATLRELEKESLARLRRSLFGETSAAIYDLFLNRLLFTEDGHDDYLNAEHYVMLGNYERDPDRFETMSDIAIGFLRSLQLPQLSSQNDASADALLSHPENAQELLGGGAPNEDTPKGKSQRALLNAWVEVLEKEGVMDHVIASYEAVPLLGQYSPPINPQQLKNALISRSDRKRVEALLEEHGKISPDSLNAAVKKVEGSKGSERAKIAGRFLSDFMRYHRDLRRMEAVTSAMDGINVIGNEKLRELSAINNTLYEFLLPEEQKPAEDKVVHHIILKADIRDSTTLTRTLFERGLNPASYFSLNFYEPVNKLLPKYQASKVFIEGDAVILALFEREGEAAFGVARTCVLAKEMIQIVQAYNKQSQKQGLPTLELGIGISYQDSAPMYLMDGNSRIMISKALNESDRLSSCTKGARKYMEGKQTPFNVFCVQTVEDKDTVGMPDEFLVRYNIGGIHMSAAAFEKLQSEISLKHHEVRLPTIWNEQATIHLYSAVVPVGQGFHQLIVRESRIPHVDAGTLKVRDWTERRYYEVCVNSSIYELIEKQTAQAAKA